MLINEWEETKRSSTEVRFYWEIRQSYWFADSFVHYFETRDAYKIEFIKICKGNKDNKEVGDNYKWLDLLIQKTDG